MRCSAVTNRHFAPLSRLFMRAPRYRLIQRIYGYRGLVSRLRSSLTGHYGVLASQLISPLVNNGLTEPRERSP